MFTIKQKNSDIGTLTDLRFFLICRMCVGTKDGKLFDFSLSAFILVLTGNEIIVIQCLNPKVKG